MSDQFMLMWSKCLKGEMPEGSGFSKIVASNTIVLAKPAAADKAGVGGAKKFFETKVRGYCRFGECALYSFLYSKLMWRETG